MGILPFNSISNQNSINDPGYELRRQLDVRKAQLDNLNSKETLSQDQLKRKQDLEQTVSMLSNKLNKKINPTSVSTSIASQKTYDEGTVIAKSPVGTKNPYSAMQISNPKTVTNINNKSDSYLKGFFFDTRI